MSSEYYTKSQVDAQAATVGARIKAATLPDTLIANIAAVNDTNFLTNAERTKLAALESSKYFGNFPTLEDIPTVGAEDGMYAHIDEGPGKDIRGANFDVDDGKWVESGVVTVETATSVKTKYESNADTNNFDDAAKAKLEGLTEAVDITSFTAALDGALA